MSHGERGTAPYKIIADTGGNRYRFYCESSGMAVYMTQPICAASPQEELEIAWRTEARKYFNWCESCRRWISDVMFNVDEMKCVDCAPWQEKDVSYKGGVADG